jgi:hypothetical protein
MTTPFSAAESHRRFEQSSTTQSGPHQGDKEPHSRHELGEGAGFFKGLEL